MNLVADTLHNVLDGLVPELHDDERGIAGVATQIALIAAGVAVVAVVG